jgi:hypothetical protein
MVVRSCERSPRLGRRESGGVGSSVIRSLKNRPLGGFFLDTHSPLSYIQLAPQRVFIRKKSGRRTSPCKDERGWEAAGLTRVPRPPDGQQWRIKECKNESFERRRNNGNDVLL